MFKLKKFNKKLPNYLNKKIKVGLIQEMPKLILIYPYYKVVKIIKSKS
jgi:hypothetical protein